jgi:type I restriction enzyme S subunit
LPEEQKKERLGNFAKLQGGYAYPSTSFISTGVPVLKIQNIRWRDVSTDELSHVRIELAQETARFFVKHGDVLISMTGSWASQPNSVVGRVARFTGESDSYLINQRVGRFIITRPEELDSRFLFFTMCARDYQDKLVSGAGGSANQANINGTQIEALTIPIPPIDEQRAIARILGALDDKIELNRQMNRTLEAMVQALFKSWFVDFDPVTEKAAGRKPYGVNEETTALFPDRFSESEWGLIPEGWHVCDIYEQADVIYGAPFASSQFTTEPNGLPLIRIRDLAAHKPEVYTPEKHPKQTVIQPGDIVVGMDGEFRVYHWQGTPALLNQRVCTFHPKPDVSKAFVLQSIREPLDFFERSKTGTTVIHLGKADIDTFRIVAPCKRLLAAFGMIADPLIDQVVANSLEVHTLAALRDALLPKLLSGEIRVRQAERLVAEAV